MEDADKIVQAPQAIVQPDLPCTDVDVDLEKQPHQGASKDVVEDTPDELLVTWDGTDDVHDPYNWPQSKKWVIIWLTSLSGLVCLMSGTMMAPGLLNIANDLDLNEEAAQLTLSIYVLAYAVGPLALAPVSEMYGRRPVWLLCGVIYCIFNTVCGFAQNNATMIAARLLAGVGSSAEFAVTLPVLADIWRPEQRGKGLALNSAIPLLGTAIGPILGGVIVQARSWHWLFWIVSIFSASNTILGFFFFPETYAPVLLSRKAKRLRKDTGHAYFTEFEKANATARSKLVVSMTRPFRLLVGQPTIQVVAVLQAYNFGINYIMLSTFAQLWTERYGQTISQSGLNYISLAVGNTVAAQIGARIMDSVYARLKRKAEGAAAPEYRVPLMIPGALLIPIGLFWYGWAGESKSYWLLTDIGVGIFACGLILSVQSMGAYLIDSYLSCTASAYAASQLLRSTAAFIFPIFAPEMYKSLGYGWGNSLLGFVSIALGIPIPLLLWKYGAWLRAKGRPLK